MSNGTAFGNYTARLPDIVRHTDSVRYADSFRNASTLLIPENTVWLPYVGIVMTVLCWLGYDFYRFHKKNKIKYERVEEHRTILRACPMKQRISMVSGIGLRFKKGKPVLGDVWNTSPSSSDVSSCCSPVRHGRAYSREVTPSSDGGGAYSEGETYSMRNASSFVTITDEQEQRPEHKGWEVGGEYVGGVPNKPTNNDNGGKSSPDSNHSPEGNNNGTVRLNITSPGSGSSSLTLTPGTTPSVESKSTERLRRMMGAGGGVDDGGGGDSGKSESSGSQDAVTQTDFDEAFFNMTTGERINYPYEKAHNPASYNTYPPPVHPMSWTPTVSSRHRESIVRPYSPYHRASIAQDICDPPVIIDFSLPHLLRDQRTVDSLGNPTAKHVVRTEKRLPSLRLDLLAAPCSPTTELVAKEHGFALEGVEVPHYAGSGSRSLPSSGSEIFKPKEPSRKSSQASVKPLTPSPAILSRINAKVPLTAPPRFSGSHHHHHHHHHRHRRPESLDIVFGMPSAKIPPARKATNSGKAANSGKPDPSTSQPQRPPRATSSSPRARRQHDQPGPLSNLKVPLDANAPKSAPIPTHLYHQDEEGFFSSSHSSSYNPSRGYPPEVDTSKKGILFFSRLAGAGRASSNTGGFGDQSTGSASSAVYGTGVYGKQGSYKSGGFES